jgi:hypothetical protein
MSNHITVLVWKVNQNVHPVWRPEDTFLKVMRNHITVLVWKFYVNVRLIWRHEDTYLKVMSNHITGINIQFLNYFGLILYKKLSNKV